MQKIWITFLLLSFSMHSMSQSVVIGPKGTRLLLDSSKWKINGNNIYNKNSGRIGIGTASPTAQLHTTGDVRLEGIASNTINTKILTADADGNITTRQLSNLISSNAVSSINGLTNSIQIFQTGTLGSDFTITSSGNAHTFNLPTASATNRGALSSIDWSTFNGKENALTFSTGLTRNANTISVNSTQNITTLSNLTTNGLIGTSGGTGALKIATAGTDYTAGTSLLSTGILKSTTGTGVLSIASASDFPILNQNTTGNAATVTTNANLTGPVTSLGNATSISANVVSNSMLSQISSQTFKGRTTTGTGNVEDLSATQATAMLNTFSSTDKGLVPASGGGTINFLRADGSWASPNTNNSRTIITLQNDVSNSTTTLSTISELNFNVIANKTYRFYAMIPYNSNLSNNGTRWTIDGPTATFISYSSRYTNGSNETFNYCNAYLLPTGVNNNSLATNLAIIQGVVIPSLNGTIQIKFAGAGSGVITAKAGASLEYW